MHVRAQRRMMQAASRRCGRDPVHGDVRMRQRRLRINPGWSSAAYRSLSISVNADYIRQNRALSSRRVSRRDIPTLADTLARFAFRGCLAPLPASWQNSRAFFRGWLPRKIHFALGQQRPLILLRFMWNISARDILLRSLPRYAGNSSAIMNAQKFLEYYTWYRIQKIRKTYLAAIHLENLSCSGGYVDLRASSAFSFRLDRTEYEREINYTYLCIVSKYDVGSAHLNRRLAPSPPWSLLDRCALKEIANYLNASLTLLPPSLCSFLGSASFAKIVRVHFDAPCAPPSPL